MTLPLIDKKDNSEVIRDQIAAILVVEIENQVSLAKLAGKDETDWKLKIYTERSNPWEQWVNKTDDTSPIVNVWFESANYDKSSSDTIERQKTNGVFNIDCYGFGESKDIPLSGHYLGDEIAARQVQKACRLIRNILMAGENTYLQLRGLVWSRWPQSLTIFQPQTDLSIQNLVGARISLDVAFNEFSPQYVAQKLEYVAIDVLRTEDGQIVLKADYNYPLT